MFFLSACETVQEIVCLALATSTHFHIQAKYKDVRQEIANGYDLMSFLKTL